MSIWDKLKKHAGAQFLDVIQWQENDHETIVYRFPVYNQAIQDGGKLIVREGQSAVFQSEGKISDSFTPGTYELSSRTKAIWGFFDSIKYGLNYPYKGDIFFVNTRQFRNQKWGSPAPFPLRDEKFGLIKLRAFGTFNYRIVDPVKFIREVVGNTGLFGTDEINGEIKNRLFDKFRNLAKEGGVSYEELDMQSEEIGAALVDRLGGELQQDYGLQLTRFTILNVNVDPKDEERIRRVEDIDVFDGRFDRYREMRQLDVMDKVAEKPGSSNSMVDAGVGLAMGQMFGDMVGGNAPARAPQAPPPPIGFHYNGVGGQGQFSAQEIANKIVANRSGAHNVWAAGWSGWKSWQQVPEISSLVPPDAAPPPITNDQRFHYNDGSNQGELNVSEIVQRIQNNPDKKHMVWKQGFSGWQEASSVASIQAALSSSPPPLDDTPPPLDDGPPPI